MIDLTPPVRHILQGDALDRLREIPKDSVDLIVTSPPYWGLRDYGVHGQLGLERTWKAHLAALKPIFREVRRVLKSTGNLWVNYGDTVATGAGGSRNPGGDVQGKAGKWPKRGAEGAQPANAPNRFAGNGPRKHKLGLAWRLRFMLNDDLGFISRADVVWHKPNQMPLSMKDRVTPKYESLFHFVKQPRYFFDLDAIRVPFSDGETWDARRARANGRPKGSPPRPGGPRYDSVARAGAFNLRVCDVAAGRADAKWGGASEVGSDLAVACLNAPERSAPSPGRNKTLGADGTPQAPPVAGGALPEDGPAFHPLGANPGDVWTIPSQPLSEAHFATYPEELVRRLVLSSCPKELCAGCGQPRRTTYTKEIADQRGRDRHNGAKVRLALEVGSHRYPGQGMMGTGRVKRTATGQTSCRCGVGFRPGVVLDPFFGSGTTGKVAAELGRDFIGIELNPVYVQIARRRLGHLLNPLDSFAAPSVALVPPGENP